MVAKIISRTIMIDGMTCVNCERRIEKKLGSLCGVVSSKVSYGGGKVDVRFDESKIGLSAIERGIENLDYKVVHGRSPLQSKSNVLKFIGILIVLIALFMILNTLHLSNFFNVFPTAKAGMGYGMLFVIGLLTSLHCVAMCGGINLSQCVTKSEVPLTEKKAANLRPSFLYNFGRVISYTVIGGIVGAIGSVVAFSGVAKGIVAIVAGIFMVIMALNMLGIFPWLRRLNPQIPKILTWKINKEKHNNSPLYVGLLSGLMPCGPLQAMQIYALSTGSPIKGAISMLLFSLGTLPLMFGLGAVSSLLNKKFTSKMMAVSASLVLILGVFMFANGMNLSGIALPDFSDKHGSVATVDGSVQTVMTKLSANSYPSITVRQGIPVRWVITADGASLNSCNSELLIQKYNIDQKLNIGENMIEFTPTASGTVPVSCWMGMIHSDITVTN
jgi:sulfite exporter TauE/SafE/copper chaperone CopZ